LTGLLSESAFTDRARLQLADAGAGDGAAVVAAFRIGGIEAIAEAYGLSVAQGAVRHLARAVEETLPTGSLLGVRFDDVLALVAPADETTVQADLGRLCREIDAAVRRHAGGAGVTPAVGCAFVVVTAPPPDPAALVAAVGRGVTDVPTGAAIPVL
jgi:GGDEF domain-containing protein